MKQNSNPNPKKVYFISRSQSSYDGFIGAIPLCLKDLFDVEQHEKMDTVPRQDKEDVIGIIVDLIESGIDGKWEMEVVYKHWFSGVPLILLANKNIPEIDALRYVEYGYWYVIGLEDVAEVLGTIYQEHSQKGSVPIIKENTETEKTPQQNVPKYSIKEIKRYRKSLYQKVRKYSVKESPRNKKSLLQRVRKYSVKENPSNKKSLLQRMRNAIRMFFSFFW